MDDTLSRLATRQDRRELRHLCRDRSDWDRTQSVGIVLAVVLAAYAPALAVAVGLAHL